MQQHLDPMEWKGKERKERWKDQDQAGHLSTWIHLLCQAASLLLQLVWTMLMAVRFVLLRTMDAAAGRWAETPTPTATHYEGYVTHQRIQPLQHNLQYPVRVCCVDLDCPPPWFQEHKKLAKTMSAGEAREKAGTNGRVLLLTQPSVAGYVMNPISIYFCYQKEEDAIASNRGVPQDGARKRASEPSGNALASTNNDAMQDERRSRGEKDPGEALPHMRKQGNKISANDPDLQHLKIGLAEVTNTPWGARVTFAFDPHGHNNAPFSLGSGPCPASVERQTRGDKQASEDHESMQFRKEVRAPTPKCLHVSPFMDMKSGWVLKARLETDSVCVSVGVKHPEMGDYFVAELRCQKSGDPHRRNEYSSWRNLLKYGFMPHRVAWWIYWHAAVLLWKGVPFVAPPSKAERAKRVESCAWPTLMANGHRLEWEDPTSFPWQSDL